MMVTWCVFWWTFTWQLTSWETFTWPWWLWQLTSWEGFCRQSYKKCNYNSNYRKSFLKIKRVSHFLRWSILRQFGILKINLIFLAKLNLVFRYVFSTVEGYSKFDLLNLVGQEGQDITYNIYVMQYIDYTRYNVPSL